MYAKVQGLKMPNGDGSISDPRPQTCLTSIRSYPNEYPHPPVSELPNKGDT
jgi:hypothetical protein